MADQVSKIPAPPAHLSAKAAKQWTKLYTDALAQAKIGTPDNERMQRMTALKAANALLAVPAPTSIADVDKMEDWQKLLDQTKLINNVNTRVVVTAYGRKYAFPVAPAAAPAPDLPTMTKAEIVAHAADAHGLQLDPGAKKEDRKSVV